MTQTLMIASPLEAENVARIRNAAAGRLDILYEPDLLPPTRYEADHKGGEFTRDAARWRALLARAEICWDLPAAADLPFAEALRWVQTTSTGVGQGVAAMGLAPGIVVTTARGVHARPLAEFVFMALLGHWRGRRASAARAAGAALRAILRRGGRRADTGDHRRGGPRARVR